ncbi:MAG TPA: UbiA family prenyltransferase [Mycobacteriales bacterium]
MGEQQVIARIRLLVVLARPAVLFLLALYAALGTARGGRPDDHLLLFGVLVVVAALLLFSVAVNDLSDEAIDRVNLPGAMARPLVTGAGRRTELRVMAAAAAVLAPVAAVPLGWRCVLVTVAALAVSAAYSLRLSSRGAVASLVLPACYVATPFLLGSYGAGAAPDLLLLAGLYVGFVGRILLKDFRDVRGDALFGKRTFLVRHGRRATCAFSAVCWAAGGALVVLDAEDMAVVTAVGAAGALMLLRMLATDGGHRRDERLISALAIVGRGLLVVLLVQLSLDRPPALLVPALVAVFAAQAAAMVAYGPPGQYSRQIITTARSSVVSVGTSWTRNAAPPR